MKISAGILLYKFNEKGLSVFLVHPGGPFWKNKEEGAWSIPKGEVDNGEDFLDTAKRELKEETGIELPTDKKYMSLGSIQQKSGKIVHAWAAESDWSGLLICKSYVEIEYPHKSRKIIKFPEVDKAGFFTMEIARKKINTAQRELLNRLESQLK